MTARSELEARYLQIAQQSPYLRSVLKPGRTVVNIETYDYEVTVGGPLNLNVPVRQVLQTHADSDFVFTSLAAAVNITAQGDMQYNRNLTLQIIDQSTGKKFFNQDTIITLVAGGGGFPTVYPAPRVLNPNTPLQFTVTNRDSTQNYNQMFLCLHGTRIYYR